MGVADVMILTLKLGLTSQSVALPRGSQVPLCYRRLGENTRGEKPAVIS